jgi:Ca-activated chloride channel family protein
MLKRKITSILTLILMATLMFTSCGKSAPLEAPMSQSPAAGQKARNQAQPALTTELDDSMQTKTRYSDSFYGEMEAGMPGLPDFNTEEYNGIKERGFVSPILEPLSTFSIDVDTASYANVRRFLMEGQDVPPDAVRIEEMINYFRYDYPNPEGDVPFSIYTELAPCPWNKESKLLLIGLKGREVDIENIPPSNLVFLLDVSGSMLAPNKLPLVKQAFLMLVENLRPTDRISIVTYAGSDRVVLEGASGEDKIRISEAIESLDAYGATAGAQGIETAYRIAREYFIPGGNNRVILATDGDFNVGVSSEGELTRLIKEKRKDGIYLSVLGFGQGNIKDNKMGALADNGNGNYAYIDTILEARKVLVEEMGGTLLTIAKDVKLQLEFNPQWVKGYRLVGYENRMLNAEDFNDDTKDAGEIGAGHRVTAFYEIIPAGSSVEVAGSDLKYLKKTLSDSDEWLTISIRYKEPDEDRSKLLTQVVTGEQYKEWMSEDFSFASAVAEFGMLLRNSEYMGDASFTGVLERISRLECVKEDQYKAEFLTLVEKAME